MKKMIFLWQTSVGWHKMSKEGKKIALVTGTLLALMLSGIWQVSIPLACIFLTRCRKYLPEVDE